MSGRLRAVGVAVLWVAACDGTPRGHDDSDVDDSGYVDGRDPLAGYGAIDGDCGRIDGEELTSAGPWWFQNTITFDAAYDHDLLSEGGKAVFDAGNLGGSSIFSEVFSFEVLYRCELAALLKTEGEIVYDDVGGKKTDLLVSIEDLTVGVSVTRAYAWPPDDPYTEAQATELLERKLGDIPLSTHNVSDDDAWVKQILHVLAYAPGHADRLSDAWAGLPDALRGDTIVLVTVTEGYDDLVYE